MDSLVKKLKDISLLYEILGDYYRSRAYSKAEIKLNDFIKDNDRLPYEDEIEYIDGIGKSIKKDVLQFYKNGRISRLDELKRSLKDEYDVIKEFMKINGIGPKKAITLYNEGFRSIEELYDADLTVRERNNLENYEMTLKRLSRKKINELVDVFNEIFDDFNFEVVGSYRRRCRFSKDIDLLFKNANMDDIINVLVEEDLLHYIISKGDSKMSGLIYITDDDLFRIDIMTAPADEWFTSLLYFTGPKDFNIAIRSLAKEKGYKLSEHGLFKNDRKLRINSEKDIFKKLGVRYVPPHERN